MALMTTVDRNKLFLNITHEMWYPLRPFELNDDIMQSYIEMVVEDYSSIVNNSLIHKKGGIENEGIKLKFKIYKI